MAQCTSIGGRCFAAGTNYFFPPRVAKSAEVRVNNLCEEPAPAVVTFFNATAPVGFFRGDLREGDTKTVNFRPPSPVTHAVVVTPQQESAPFRNLQLCLNPVVGGLGLGGGVSRVFDRSE